MSSSQQENLGSGAQLLSTLSPELKNDYKISDDVIAKYIEAVEHKTTINDLLAIWVKQMEHVRSLTKKISTDLKDIRKTRCLDYITMDFNITNYIFTQKMELCITLLKSIGQDVGEL